uniref:Bm1324 n=1 Tax=Brugia malayi TaxID=6279 RepID=A0A0J9XV76_BRUMA|nr:Bm1324 [Brugia malayi]
MDMETLTWCAIMSSCGSLTLVIVFNGILLCLLEHGHATAEIALCEEKFIASLRVAKFAALPMVGVVALSQICDLSIEQVVGEYDKDSMERRAIIYTVIGQDYVTKQFIDTCPKFLQNGYEEEYLLFTDKL